MRAVVLLADSAQADPSGKVHALGLGWSVTGSPTAPSAVVAFIHVEWAETNEPFRFRLEMLDADGHQVFGPTPAGSSPILIEGDLEAGRPPGLSHGTELTVPIAVNIGGGLPLVPGHRYEWRLTIDTRVSESASFTIRTPSPFGPIVPPPSPTFEG